MYDFDTIINQKNTQDEKHDQMMEYFNRDDLLPMWVAEMDFQTAPEILNALEARVHHGIFGYTYRSERYQEALVDWYQRRHLVTIDKSMIAYDTGVLKSIFEMIRIFTEPGDEICIPVPAYPQFEKVISLSKRKVSRFPLEDVMHRYEIDFEALSKRLSTCRMMILCSPHNPGGRIWSKDELTTISLLCKQHHVILLSDEIHCDLTMKGKSFTSMLAIDEDCIVMNSMSKPFNLAGLQHSYSICRNREMNQKIAEHYVNYKIKSMNTLSMLAQEIAYTKGEMWLEECCAYIEKNNRFVRDFIQTHDLNIPVFTLDAGYLLWMDFSSYFQSGDELDTFLKDTCHIATSIGRNFDASCACFTRLNIATSLMNCKEAMERIDVGLKNRKESI